MPLRRNVCNRDKIHLVVAWTPYAMTWMFLCQKSIGRNRWLPEFAPHFDRGRELGEERGLVWHLTI